MIDDIQMNPGLAALWEEETERRKVKNLDLESIHPPASQPRPNVTYSNSHQFYKTKLEEKLRQGFQAPVVRYSSTWTVNLYNNNRKIARSIARSVNVILRSQ